ncbi:alpha-galactosidase [uncultured Sulfitobacter sp.]|uniref:alpha-galactosidase n=1 Tax=uncultured Sulfitobacter sp. TaxID=191468 RepID=UPI002605915C|nr:alpha-galactosidase [uncultured Sulfitobacter sp.]
MMTPPVRMSGSLFRANTPDASTPLIEHVHSFGMMFGLWFGSEMIFEDSGVCRVDSDCASGASDPTQRRQQKPVNMALPHVGDYLCDQRAIILCDNPIDYIKWDHRRVLPIPDAALTHGTYALFDRLRAGLRWSRLKAVLRFCFRTDSGITCVN